MALGASRERILGWMLRQGLVLTGTGIALGAVAALAASELLSSWLFGLEAQDPLTLGAAVLLLGAAGMAASLSPARRATRVDPVESLKRE
jgi:ABC-type antimicrobial peptide transport system permease subunit